MSKESQPNYHDLTAQAESQYLAVASGTIPYSGDMLDRVFVSYEAAEGVGRSEGVANAEQSFTLLADVAERLRLVAVGANDQTYIQLFEGRRENYKGVSQALGSTAVASTPTHTPTRVMDRPKQY